MGEFDGKVAVVTGGASWIGLAIAERLVEAGGSVVLGDLDGSTLGNRLDRLGDAVRFQPTDVTDDAQLDGLLDAAADAYGGVDIVVSGAARFAESRLATSREEWHVSLDVNVVSVAILIFKAAPRIAERGGGAVVNITSISGRRSQPNRVVYPVTKAALLGLTRNAAQQLAGSNIRVNAVSPGWTWSRNIEHRYGSRERADALAAEFQVLGRMADPSEIADAVAYLASDRSSFVTGIELPVDGGYTAIGPEAMGQPFEKVPPVS